MTSYSATGGGGGVKGRAIKEAKVSTAISLGGGGKALMALPLKKKFFASSLSRRKNVNKDKHYGTKLSQCQTFIVGTVKG